MSALIAGFPLRSIDVRRQALAAAGASRAAVLKTEDVQHGLDAVRLALLAVEPPLPADLDDGAGLVTRFARAVPGAGCETLGPVVVTARVDHRPALADPEPQGQGAIELLRPETIWAARSEGPVEEVSALMDPAYLVGYNEVLIPFVAGDEISLRLHHDTGSDLYAGIRTTTVYRFAELRRFNGRIDVESRSHARYGGMYVHAGASPAMFKTSWLDEGELVASQLAGQAGTATVVGATAYGSVQGPFELDPDRLFIDGVEVDLTASHTLTPSSRVEVRCPLAWDRAVGYVGIRIQYA